MRDNVKASRRGVTKARRNAHKRVTWKQSKVPGDSNPAKKLRLAHPFPRHQSSLTTQT